MKTKNYKRVLALVLMSAMIFSACGQKTVTNTTESKETQPSESVVAKDETAVTETEEDINKEDLPIITFYPNSELTFSGLLGGYRGDIIAENVGIQVEHWSYSEAKTNAMLVSGDYPDIMVVKTNTDMYKLLVEQDKIINYDDYQEYLPNIFENPTNELWPEQLKVSREIHGLGTGNLYVLPGGLGHSMTEWQNKGSFDRNVPKVKWDVYTAIGAPEINDMWDLIDVMEDMLEYQPTLEDGTKMYGTFLDNGRDGSYWGSCELFYRWYGYDYKMNEYFIEGDTITGEINSILTEDSLYYECLKWYNEINRRGLMDPDSISTSRADQAPKLDNGFAMIPSGTLPGYADKYYEVFVPGLPATLTTTPTTIAGAANAIVINKETEHLEECLAYINAVADPYIMLQINYGPEGEMWQKDGNVVSITEEFAAWLKDGNSVNFFPMSDGTEWSAWYGASLVSAPNELNGYVGVDGKKVPITPYIWPDALEITEHTENFAEWQELFDAKGLIDYCEKNNITMIAESIFNGLTLPSPDDTQKMQMASIKDVVVTQSWLCVYAKDDKEFDEAWDKMIKDAMGLGAQEIIDWRIQCYKDALAAK